ncbi:GNAT family N-acetyltransferase [Xylophilus sp.]|uniref:GNAT family N-acetyltransferase n=1 Tax=Xylophilus sp. TaxID=2653893 RepID=UPI002D802133|nr:GNAT family N-acetyltransferase [Xylophilus sp.]
MRPVINLRLAAQNDLDIVASVWHESAAQMDAAVIMPLVVDLRTRIDFELENGWLLFVAESADKIVGMLALKPKEGRLDQIFVLPSFQGKGIGAEFIKEAKRQMPAGFTLRMAEGNTSAAGFYKHLGFKIVGRGPHPVSGTWVRYYRWTFD